MTHNESIALLPELGKEALSVGNKAIALLRQLVTQQPVPDDALLTLADARSRYGLSMPALRSISILEGGRRKVKQSAIRKYIADL